MNLSLNNSYKNEIKQSIGSYKSSSSNKNSQSLTHKNTIEYDNVISKNISKNTPEMTYKNDESDIKMSTNKDKNGIHFYTPSNNDILEGSNNKNIYSSLKKTMNDEVTKFSLNKNNSFLSNNEIKNTLNNNSLHLKKNKIPIHSKLITHYENWKGYNYFPFKGHIIEGPCSFRPTLMTGCAMTIPAILFFIFNSKYITDELTVFIPIIIGILFLITFVYLIVATFSDPGIIRRFNLVNDNKYKDYINNNNLMNIKRNDSKIFQLGYIHNYKYCPTCGIIRPNRSTHCCDCNNCVERLDHHCPWIGNCAGKRNYIYFFIFLILLNILTILIIIFSIIYIVSKVKDYRNLNDELPNDKKISHLTAFAFCDVIISLYLIIYCILTMCFITGLIFYHSRLVLINSTTKEELRHIFKNQFGNPYKRSICTNIKNVLCLRIKKYSILDILRGDIKEICDHENNSTSNDIIKTQEDINETNINLKLEPKIINKLNDESNYINIIKDIDKDNIVINNDNQGKEKSYNNVYNSLENNLLKEPQNERENINKNSYSFETIGNNPKLEEYLKYFGTGINTNHNNKLNF